MKRLRHPILANAVIGCVLFLGGVLSSHAFLHSDHQGHHSTEMHTDLLCAWMCVAGQVLQFGDSPFFGPSHALWAADWRIFSSVDLLLVQSSHSRDPPPYRIDFT
jgi:hypothetical protein